MEMGEREICVDYRLAKNKRRQIGILAALNDTTQEEILDILHRNGVTTRIKLDEKPETLKKTERDELAKMEFVEKSTLSKSESAESRINCERPTNYNLPEEVLRLVENRILELNKMAEEARATIDRCTEEYAKLFEFKVANGAAGEKYHTTPQEATAAEVTTAKEVQ